MRYVLILLVVCCGVGAGERDPLQAEWQALKIMWMHRRATMTPEQQEAHKQRMALVLAELKRRAALR